jgi:5'-methylthioadenosine phosphorylase
VTDVISVSACGSFREEMAPGDFVIVDQFIDRTFAREKSFFGTGLVAHVSVAHPTCPRLSAACLTAARDAGITAHDGGTYLAMEGPQFSSLAESKLYREVWGCDVIGMTNMPEAKLAREAELCYASVAMVTDYDSWHPDHGEVDIAEIVAILTGNADNARSMVAGCPVCLGDARALPPWLRPRARYCDPDRAGETRPGDGGEAVGGRGSLRCRRTLPIRRPMNRASGRHTLRTGGRW